MLFVRLLLIHIAFSGLFCQSVSGFLQLVPQNFHVQGSVVALYALVCPQGPSTAAGAYCTPNDATISSPFRRAAGILHVITCYFMPSCRRHMMPAGRFGAAKFFRESARQFNSDTLHSLTLRFQGTAICALSVYRTAHAQHSRRAGQQVPPWHTNLRHACCCEALGAATLQCWVLVQLWCLPCACRKHVQHSFCPLEAVFCALQQRSSS
jgi:hypothetical protein